MDNKQKSLVGILIIVLLSALIIVFSILGIIKAKNAIDAVNSAAENKEQKTAQAKPETDENVPAEDIEKEVLQEESEKAEGEDLTQTDMTGEEKDVVDIEKLWSEENHNSDGYADFSSLKVSPDIGYSVMPEDFFWFDESIVDEIPPENTVELDINEAFGEYDGVIVGLVDFPVYDFVRVTLSPQDASEVFSDTAKEQPVKAVMRFETLYSTNEYADVPQITEGIVTDFNGELAGNIFTCPFLDSMPISIYFYGDGKKVFAKGRYYGEYAEGAEYIVLLTKK